MPQIDPQRLAMIMQRMGGQGGMPQPQRPMMNAPPGPAPMPQASMPPPAPGMGAMQPAMPQGRVGGPFGGMAQNGPRQGMVGAGMQRRY